MDDMGASGMDHLAPYSFSPGRRKKFAYAAHHEAGIADSAGSMPTTHGHDPMFGQGDATWTPSMNADATRPFLHPRPPSTISFGHCHYGQSRLGPCDPAPLSLPNQSLGSSSIACAPYPHLTTTLNGGLSYLEASPSFEDNPHFTTFAFFGGPSHGSFADCLGFNPMAASRTEATSPAKLMAENYVHSGSHPQDSSLQSTGSASEIPRSLLASPASGSATSGESYLPLGGHGLAASRPTNGQGLPFVKFHSLKTLKSEGQVVTPAIHAHVVKNVFFHEGVWTCYRRNYISVECSYTLDPCIDNAPLYMCDEKKETLHLVQALAICLHASVDKSEGKSIELVQHTAKRDRGPQFPLRIEKLSPAPRGHPNAGYSINVSAAPLLPLQCEESGDSSNVASPNPKQCQHTFERVQFKQATANNGRRRAQQQYYHLIVALYVDVRDVEDTVPKWVKVAHQLSDPMVVRGRSPGHYSNDDSRAESSGRPGAGGNGAGGHGAGGPGTGGHGAGGHGGASSYTYTHAANPPSTSGFSSSVPAYAPSSYQRAPQGSYHAQELRPYISPTPATSKRTSFSSSLTSRPADTAAEKFFVGETSPFGDSGDAFCLGGSAPDLTVPAPQREGTMSVVPRLVYPASYPPSFKEEFEDCGASSMWQTSSYAVEGNHGYDFHLGPKQ